MKKCLFYTVLLIFIATAIITLGGVTGLIPVSKEYLDKLFYAFILESALPIFTLFKKTDFFSQEAKNTTEADTKTLCKSDRDLFYELKEALPTDENAVQFLKDHDMGAVFERSHIKPLCDFRHYWDTPDHEFANEKLNCKLKQFISNLKAFNTRLSTESQPHQVLPDSYRIVSHIDDYKRFNEVRDILNKLSSDAYDSLCDLIKTGRKMI